MQSITADDPCLAIGECLGWLARAAAHNCPYNKTLYSLQIIVLVLGAPIQALPPDPPPLEPQH